MSDLSDQALIDGCLAGNTAAFGELVQRYQDRLYGSLVRITGASDLAQDVAQDAFVQAFQKLASFRGQSQFYSWLFRIALNAAVSRRRKLRKMTSSVEAVREATGFEPVDSRPEIQPSQPLEVAERQEIVQRALSELSEEFRTVLVLKEIDEMKYEEIAAVLNVPVGTVRSRIHRARMELRLKLQCALKLVER